MDKIKVIFLILTSIILPFSILLFLMLNPQMVDFVEMVNKLRKIMKENYQNMWTKEFVELTLEIEKKNLMLKNKVSEKKIDGTKLMHIYTCV